MESSSSSFRLHSKKKKQTHPPTNRNSAFELLIVLATVIDVSFSFFFLFLSYFSPCDFHPLSKVMTYGLQQDWKLGSGFEESG